MSAGLDEIALDEADHVRVGRLPSELVLDDAATASLWALHPPERSELVMYGRRVRTPRWQKAYGADYVFTGNVSRADEVPAMLAPLLEWAQRTVHPRINGLLLNWYDAEASHYIGKHRDSTINMVEGAPIVTASFGAARTFRFRRWRGEGLHDLRIGHGDVVVIPYATNRRWTHEVPHFANDEGRRISVTMRAFVKTRAER